MMAATTCTAARGREDVPDTSPWEGCLLTRGVCCGTRRRQSVVFVLSVFGLGVIAGWPPVVHLRGRWRESQSHQVNASQDGSR